MNLQEEKIIVVAHFYNTGPPQNFEEYLVNKKAGKVFAISHPLLYEDKNVVTEYRLYEKGVLMNQVKKPRKRLWSILFNFSFDAWATVWRLFKSNDRWDLFVGAGNLNAFCGVILRVLGKVDKVVYYSIDFIPIRFDNKLINSIYRWVEKICVKFCDEIWNLSPKMAEGREKYLGLTVKKYGFKQKLVFEGAWMDRTKQYPPEKVNQHHLVFLGHIVERMGVQMVIQAIPEIISSIPDFKFLVIGKGHFLEQLKKIASELKVSHYIDFKGFVADHKDVEDIIAKCGVGVAPYVNDPNSLTYYADPGKTKIYMSAGAPVVMTDLFFNAYEIEEAKGGLVVSYDSSSIAKAVIELMSDRDKWLVYRKGAIAYMWQLDWNVIFDYNLKNLL